MEEFAQKSLQEMEAEQASQKTLLCACGGPNPASLETDGYAALFDFAPSSCFLLDRQGTLRQTNRKAAEMLASSPDKLVGKPFSAFIDSMTRPMFEHHLGQVFDSGTGHAELILKGGGGPVTVSLHTARIDNAAFAGQPLCLATAHDISQYKKAERELAQRTEQLARSNDDLERFAYVISHDMQEPLRNIGNYVQMLSRRYKGQLDEDADLFIGFVSGGVFRLSGMIRDLLSFSRITTRGRALEPIDSGAALGDALANLEALIEETGAEIHTDKMPPVLADRAQLVSLFQNLLSNALKYKSPDRKPVVRVQVRPVNESWMFSVSDNGIGIERHQFERLFILFQRIEPNSQVPGSGIGLAVCKRIVERHGGNIWVESTPGKGSTFYFMLGQLEPIL